MDRNIQEIIGVRESEKIDNRIIEIRNGQEYVFQRDRERERI